MTATCGVGTPMGPQESARQSMEHLLKKKFYKGCIYKWVTLYFKLSIIQNNYLVKYLVVAIVLT